MTTDAKMVHPPHSTSTVDVEELRDKVREMYRLVAQEPETGFHFETGRALAERLGYPAADLDRIPLDAVASFAGVGHHLDLAAAAAGDTVVDLGSGSGMDAFLAARAVGRGGKVIGVDMTPAQLKKATMLAQAAGFARAEFRFGYLEDIPVPSGSADVVISNGVINLCADKGAVFGEIARVLRRGGRVALSDIVTAVELPDNVSCNTTLWAACIGGAMQEDKYRGALESAGLRLLGVRPNVEYRFLSLSAQSATREYGVRSVSLLAEKP